MMKTKIQSSIPAPRQRKEGPEMNNIHSDKCNLAVNASEYSSMAHTYLRKINKKYT